MIFAQYDDDDTDFSFDNELNKKKRSEEEEEEEGDKQSTVKRYNGDRWSKVSRIREKSNDGIAYFF